MKTKGAKANNQSAAGGLMADAKQKVKNAKKAVQDMAAGNKGVSMAQVANNVTLAANAVNQMMSNGTAQMSSAMLAVMSMTQNMQQDMKAMSAACPST